MVNGKKEREGQTRPAARRHNLSIQVRLSVRLLLSVQMNKERERMKEREREGEGERRTQEASEMKRGALLVFDSCMTMRQERDAMQMTVHE